MRVLLLDTQAFLWLITNDRRLSTRARAELADPRVRAVVSIATIWEISIKAALGKLPLPGPVEPYLRDRIKAGQIGQIAVEFDDAVAVALLPRRRGQHGDPFDRMIITQAKRRNLTIIGNDAEFDRYGVTRVW